MKPLALAALIGIVVAAPLGAFAKADGNSHEIEK